jgi:hypothetical protein
VEMSIIGAGRPKTRFPPKKTGAGVSPRLFHL